MDRAEIRMNCLEQFPEAGAGLQSLGNICKCSCSVLTA